MVFDLLNLPAIGFIRAGCLQRGCGPGNRFRYIRRSGLDQSNNALKRFNGFSVMFSGFRRRVQKGYRNRQEGMPDVVKHHQLVRNHQLRDGDVLGQAVGDFFKKRYQFIGEISHHASPESGKPGIIRRAVCAHNLFQDIQRVPFVRNGFEALGIMNIHPVPKNLNAGTGGKSQKTVSSPSLSAFNAFKKKYRALFIEAFLQQGNRGFRICQNFNAQGNDIEFFCHSVEFIF